MAVWFEGETYIECGIEDVKRAVDNLGELFVGVVSLMPGLTSVDLVQQQSDSVTLRTNEGLMTRTSITKRREDDRVVLEYDERYEAGSTVTTTAHFCDEFEAHPEGVIHHLAITNLEAPGFMGFFYRRFGSSKTGTAFLTAHKTYLESQDG